MKPTLTRLYKGQGIDPEDLVQPSYLTLYPVWQWNVSLEVVQNSNYYD